MFGLLNPLALWLAPLVAAPLIIHFLGRRPPQTKDFPSLLLVRGRLAHAMRRHHLKNWLQLLLRTLAIFLLVLSASNPLWRQHAGFAPPEAAGILLANNAYGAVPLGGETGWSEQDRLRRTLDSVTSGHCTAGLILRNAAVSPGARFGRYDQGVMQLLRGTVSARSYHIYLPVFAWSDLESVRGVLLQALRDHPRWRLVLTEYPTAAASLSPFGAVRVTYPSTGLAAVHVDRRAGSAALQAASWMPAGDPSREIPVTGDSLQINIPLPESGWITGLLSAASDAAATFAYPQIPISLRVSPPAMVCHVGNPFASLASLGQGGLRLHIQTLPSARAVLDTHCDLLYLADPPDLDADVLERAAEILRGGGKVILGLGRNTDPALLNRDLLVPLQAGRLTALSAHAAEPIQPQVAALAKLGWATANWGNPGEVSTEITFIPDAETRVLLAAGGNPLLAYRRVGAGALLLWTTDVNNPDWTDVGLGPWLALAHQAFAAGSGNAGSGLVEVASDSVFQFSGSENDGLRVTDPQGAVFPRVRREAAGWSIGPFDRLGIYSVLSGADTLRLAVRLEAEAAPTPSDWSAARTRFLSGWGDLRPRLSLRRADAAGSLYGGIRLRTALLVTAALLLLLEGFISLRLAPGWPAAARE